ncbi:TOR1 [Mytilus coruscus]|uniref:TOR1 n=1 Tax=Mytilus coruscus TaxID=42192 RepID=A0A6J8EUX1_MYTCO|nr:TOR1 [Mytilus coruscus]
MGNCLQCFISCLKFNSLSNDHNDTTLLDSKTSNLDHTLEGTKTDNGNKAPNSKKTKTQRVDSQNKGAVCNDGMYDSKNPELDTVDDKNTQITEVGTKLVQTLNQYNIKVEIHNPSANALIIGNDNRVNISKKEIDRQPIVEHIKVENKDTKDETKDAFKSSVMRKVAGTICKETLAVKIAEIKAEFQNIVDKLNEKLRKSVIRTGHANKRIISGLNEKSKILLSDANNKLLQLEKDRILDIDIRPLSITHEIGSASDRDKMTSFAKFKCLILKKVSWYVSTLLPLKIQQFIIVFTFECQKSFVLKQMMIDFDSSDVSSIMKYIFNPNEYAKNWLVSFTDNIVFYRKSPNKLHVYAEIAKKEVEKVFDELKLAITSTKHRKGEINNLSDWAKCFLQSLKSMPLSSKDLGDFQSLSNVSVKEFIDLFSSNLDSMKREIITNFKNTTINNVQWTDNPYNKIIECLWRCTECCPFCHEPCQYSDIEHITQKNKHKCIQHRPLVVYGSINDDSNIIMLDNCNSLIKSPDRYFKLINEDDPQQFSNYDQAFIGWEILPVVAADECKYWKWVMCNRKDQLQQFFSTNTHNIPEEWNYITEEEAIHCYGKRELTQSLIIKTVYVIGRTERHCNLCNVNELGDKLSLLIQLYLFQHCLSGNLVDKVHGQHIAVEAVRSYINAQMLDKDPKKALSLAFHGGPGTGKTYISSIIAESLYDKGMKSDYVHFISATHHFPDEVNIKQYKVNIKHCIFICADK